MWRLVLNPEALLLSLGQFKIALGCWGTVTLSLQYVHPTKARCLCKANTRKASEVSFSGAFSKQEWKKVWGPGSMLAELLPLHGEVGVTLWDRDM